MFFAQQNSAAVFGRINIMKSEVHEFFTGISVHVQALLVCIQKIPIGIMDCNGPQGGDIHQIRPGRFLSFFRVPALGNIGE